MRLLCARVPVEQVLNAPDTAPALRAKLERVGEVRRFAERLGLAVGGRYTEYAPWPGDFVVTTVVAARPGEVVPVTSWFPIVGSVPAGGRENGAELSNAARTNASAASPAALA